jgi:hypothetical protein
VFIYSAANDIQHQYDNLFSSARIISDIRTIFDPNGSDPVGALIVHNLQIRYSNGNEFKEAFFALDNADLSVLRKALERAETKTVSLESVIRKAELKYFESKPK